MSSLAFIAEAMSTSPNPTSTIDFDYIKITKGDKISFSRSNTNDDKVPSAQAATDPYQSYSDKQICTMVGALNGLARAETMD